MDTEGKRDTMTTLLAAELAAGAEEVRELPMSPTAFGLTALGVLLALLAVTWAFRSAGSRH